MGVPLQSASIKVPIIGQPPWTGVPGVNPDLLPIVIANYRLAHLPGCTARIREVRLDCEWYSGQVAKSRWLRIQSVNHVFALTLTAPPGTGIPQTLNCSRWTRCLLPIWR
jgi:hypothetical protein